MTKPAVDRIRYSWQPFGDQTREARPDLITTIPGIGYARVFRIAHGPDRGAWQWVASTWDMQEIGGTEASSRAAAAAAEKVLDGFQRILDLRRDR